ncbi:MAG: 2-oxo acid dehydrogenase subunit E2 [Deltaproteobacteria bacterium]|nr:MAG: 2-oxo acid dehydrogenase subunit E2 [Deltaproteobacteria bacterium]
MAKVEIVMPQMGESITTGTITKWTKAPGDIIEVDEILLEISTDKVESEIPSPYKGRVEFLHFSEGDTVDVGTVIAELETDLSVEFSGGGAPSPKAEPVEKVAEAPKVLTKAPSPEDEGRKFYTPLVKALAKEAGIPLSELGSITGTGAGGRVNKADFLAFLGGRGQSPEGISTTSEPTRESTKSVVVTSPSERVEIIPMNNMRKIIARNMVLSKATSPHVNSIAEVDMTKIVKFRESVKGDFKRDEGFNLTYTHFIMFAIVKTLREFPTVNASLEGDNIILKKYINLGFAVATGDGLVVPNVKDADSLNMLGLARSVNELAEKARTKKLSMDDLSDGTFTFTNNGSFGTLFATPIILQPQVGIYCAGVIKKQLVVGDDDSFNIRSIMYGTHTYDHRLVDGSVGGTFLYQLHKNLEEMDPAALF